MTDSCLYYKKKWVLCKGVCEFLNSNVRQLSLWNGESLWNDQKRIAYTYYKIRLWINTLKIAYSKYTYKLNT